MIVVVMVHISKHIGCFKCLVVAAILFERSLFVHSATGLINTTLHYCKNMGLVAKYDIISAFLLNEHRRGSHKTANHGGVL